MPGSTGHGPRVLVLGIAGQYPLAGVIWQALQYLVGLQRLGCDVWYVEDSGAPPYDPRHDSIATAATANVAALAAAMRALDLGERWAYWDALTGDWHGLARARVDELYDSAELIFNLCGATKPREEHHRRARLCYVETDPVYEQIRVANGNAESSAFLAAHDVLFTYGELLGTPLCAVPVGPFRWIPTRPPVVLDCWADGAALGVQTTAPGAMFRSIATWENKGKDVEFRGETYQWSKHLNFVRMIDVPRLAGETFELAMDPLDPAVRAELAAHGWRLVDPRPISADLDAYRAFVRGARGEFTVAKDIYVRPRSGWFSDRSVCFLAAGKPVVTQETGFSTVVPSGRGLLAFSDVAGAVEAVRRVGADYAVHAAAARAIAAEHFAAERVIAKMLDAAAR
jgi:hypothetical protein